MSVDVVEEVIIEDIEDSLLNHDGHFRNCHFECAKQMSAGMIIEANCGKLYRTTGQLMRIITSECGDCIKNIGKKACPVCNKGGSKEG